MYSKKETTIDLLSIGISDYFTKYLTYREIVTKNLKQKTI